MKGMAQVGCIKGSGYCRLALVLTKYVKTLAKMKKEEPDWIK